MLTRLHPSIRTCHFVIILVLPAIFSSCRESASRHDLVKELLEVDREFSRLTQEVGSNQAFLHYIDENCVILRPNRNPVTGKQKIVEMFSKPDSSFTLSWEPLYADVSSSGDIGYTYGVYTIHMDSPEGEKVKKQGTYAVIWKKDENGQWKFVLDTGNQGLGPVQD